MHAQILRTASNGSEISYARRSGPTLDTCHLSDSQPPSNSHAILFGSSGYRYFSCYITTDDPRYDMYIKPFTPQAWIAIGLGTMVFAIAIRILSTTDSLVDIKIGISEL